MNLVAPPLRTPTAGHPPEDDFDGLLRSFFRSEMPDPWPAAPVVAPSRLLPASKLAARPALFHSRLALAASVALLIAGSLFLSGKLRQPENGPASPATSSPAARREKLPGIDPGDKLPYNLIQKSDGTHIEIKIFEEPPSK